MLRNPISHGGLLSRGNRKGTVRRDDKEATEQIDFHLLFQTFLITSGASPRRPCDPLFCKVEFSCRCPLEAFLFFFFLFLGRTGNCAPTLFYCVWVVLSSVVLATQAVRKLGWGGWGGGVSWLQEPRRCCCGAAAALASVYLFIYSFNKGQNACRWRLMVIWTFYHACIYSLIY